MSGTRGRRYHAAVWDEPLVHELGHPGRRGALVPGVESEVAAAASDPLALVSPTARRRVPPALPELSEWEVLRHYLHLSQQTLGMMGVSLFGTCTMKYNPALSESLTSLPQVREVHPLQHEDTVQGLLEIVYRLDLVLRELSGMDRFVFQPGGGADAAWLHVCMTRAYHADRGELAERDEVVTTIQAHPCNAATAAAAGFKVITLPLEEGGRASLSALRSAISERTAALMVNNPDDMGIYNPDIGDWVESVHSVGGLCFYDHANFNGVMGKLRAADLGFDACMFMLHKTFGAPKGNGPAVGAYGCTERLAHYLPGPLVTAIGLDGKPDPQGASFDLPAFGRADVTFRLVEPERGVGRVREYLGNLPQVVKAYAWVRAMGADGIGEASDLSVLVSNYIDARLRSVRGVTRSNPEVGTHRLEMCRYSLETLAQETGVGAVDVQHRMTDFGIDAFWLSHEPWIVPEPFTPEAGELWSKEDVDEWLDVLALVCAEAYEHPEVVRTAPHRQVTHRLDGGALDDPARWATTWRAYRAKRPAS
ncbi:MAG: aminomethyl-transferring glycine dehydrogenase subunit GcvPB [Actinomycetota bacterium]|jgi:glycine dehydrogenase subunit 2|nr:aminomethyl-transferring glycine dehydrogenase subunit GcvPB [Actinomycetota bacterium]